MGSSLYNKNRMILADYMNSYFSHKSTDCTIYSDDGYEFPIHKELLCQTKFMCSIVKNAEMECCNHMDIMIPSLSKYDLEYLVEFLYSGQISCSDQETVSQVVSNLSKFLGFPDSMDLSSSPDLPQNFCGNFQENENFEDENKEFDYEDTESNEIGVKVEFTEVEQDESREAKYSSNQKFNTIPSDFDISTITWGPGVCPLCEKHFQKLREHIEINHSANKPWKCEIENCDFTHAKKWGITAHMKNAIHLPPEENSLENEGSTPPKRGRRPGTRDHDESKITHGPGICPHCEKHYQKLRHHVETVHAKHKPWKCELCDYRHAKHWGITEHMKNVHKKNSEQPSPYGVKRGRPPGTKNFDETKLTHGPGICPHCEKHYQKLREHVDRAHLTERPYKCEPCGFSHAKRWGLETHLQSREHKKNTEGPQDGTCDTCGEYFTELNKHIKTTHFKKNKVDTPQDGICPHCGEYFKVLEQHIKYKHETNKPWKCTEQGCDYAHALKHGLSQHMKASHPKESDLKICHLCGKKHSTNSNLKQHMEMVHEKKRKYTCNICDAEFYFNHQYEQHVKVKHMGESNIKCDQCDMTFNNSSAKWRHIRIVHEGVKYTCQTCGKEYADKKRLKMHMLKHHGEIILDSKVKNWHTSLGNRSTNMDALGGRSSYSEQPSDLEQGSFTEQSSDMETSTGALDDVSRN